jgi:hypothetical protein
MLAAVHFDPLFNLHEAPTCVFQLRLEKLIRALGQHLAVSEALVDEQRGEALRDLHRPPRLVGHVADLK